ncbi:MAG: leucine-rich repeat protein [Clostridia bacterium]|nr:leucine-rich repeat protein [Clostridia bacterium]
MMTHRARSLKAVLCILAAAIVFFLPSLSRSARAEEPVAITVPGITVTVKDGSTGDPAAGYIMRQMTGVGAPPTKGASGFSKLEGNDARLYTALKPLIAEVAAGERGSTVFEIPVTEIYEKIYYTFEELGAVDGDAAQAAFQDRIAFDIGKVNSALLVDCPYELYWYDKTSGIGSQGYSYSMTSTAVFFPENNTIPIYLYVSAEYSVSGSSGTFDMDTSWGTSVQAAASTARGIVTANAGLGDIAKLTAYKDAICGRVDYNFDALAAGTLYGNPWQLIWVFDNDPTTKVVCEGYSKAFQFLCDESAFSGSTSSIIVSGTMQGGTGAGGHMWNVVTLDNGRKYLADVTNSDAGSVGQDGGLFLDGYTNKEALSDGRVAYTYEIGSQSITYWYDSKIIDLYGPDDLSLPEIIDQGTLDGGIAWALDDNGLLTLEGTGEAAVASADAQPWYSYRSGITSVHVSEGITSLGDHLFHGLNALESVDLPSGLESIRAYTFDNCAALQAVDLPAGLTSIGNYAFDGCHALMSVVIPDTVTSLGKDVFSNCHALSSAVVGSGVTDLPEGAFNNCESLADVTFRGELMSIGPWAFSNGDSNGGQIWAMSSFTVPDTVMSIGAYAFNLQTGLTEMVLPASVEEIGAYAFKSCRGLTSVTVLDRDAEFGEGAFDQCTGMTLRGYACSTAADYAAANDITYQAIPGGDHVMTAHPKLEATCTEEGTEAYWECTVCGKLFSDENGTTQIDEPVAIAAGHTLTAHAKKEVTCTEDGMEAYWECTVCGCIFADGDGLAELDALPVIYTDGHDLTENPKVEATCTENGMEAYWECGVCGKLFADADALMEIDAPVTIPGGHHLTAHEKQDANCTTDGMEAYWECDVCGKLFSDADAFTEIDEPVTIPGGHHLTAHEKQDATCTENGMEAYWECTVCGCIFADGEGLTELDALPVIYTDGHDLTENPKVEATCTENGMEAYWECGVCGKLFADADALTEIDAPVTIPGGHHLTAHEKQDATCTSDGKEAYWECDVCGMLFSDADAFTEIDEPVTIPGGHELTGYWQVDATCTSDGTEAYWECTVCGKLFADADALTQIDAPVTIPGGHDLTAHERQDATCTQDGMAAYWECRVCGSLFADGEGLTGLDALPVIYSDGHTLTENPEVEATCTENGTEAYWECSICGKLFADADALMEIDAPVTIPGGHHLTTHEKQDATCTSDGTEAYWECDACGKLFADADAFIEIDEPEVIPGGHELLEYWQVAATCTKAGNTAYWACEACGKYFSDAEGTDEIEENSWVISALGHNLTGTAAKDATSTEAGNTAYWTCEACGKYFSDAQGDTEIEEGSWVIPPLGAPVLTVSDVGSSYDYNDVVELRADVTCPSASDEELLDRYPDARITASLITADGDTVSGFIVQSVSGLEASFRFPLGDDSMGPGYYKIRVETNVEGLAADSASFYYTAEKNDLPDPADCRVKLTLNTTIFGLNERFRLTARVTNTAGEPVQGIRVGFQVLDLNGDITDFYTGYSYLYNTTNGEGTCSITSTLSEEEIFPAGHYVARVFILDGDSSDSLPFEFVRADHSTHQYVKVEGTAPTCTDAGTETYWKCSVCCLLFSAQNENAQISAPATIPARGHTPVVDPAVAATVDSTGLTEGSHCSVCGAILKAQQVIPKIDEPAIAVIDAATFPDKAFLAWVSANADTNRDGKLTKTEIASVKSADLSAVRTVEKLDGIELFTALEALDVSDNKLTELDVSGLTELRTLKADNNKLTCLDLSGNTKLTALSCAGSAYTVKVKAGVIDLSAFKGFDVSRASAFGTGKVSGTTLTVLEPGDVTYTYDCGRNFKAVFTLKVTADPVDVTKVTTSKVKYAYTGKEIEPVLTVTATVDGREITLDEKQYEAEFKDNVKAGKATVKVTGTGFFKGSVETAFEITKVKLASATLKYTKTTYTGKALKPTATVKAKVGGKTVTLKSGTDYSLTYKNNTDAGKATVTVKGKGNFTGTLTKTFTITGAPITEAKVKNASLPYNGKAKTPILIVKAKVGTRTVTLKKSTDYTATYANNTNVGTATVTVKGRGNYSGTVKCTFKINPLKLSTGKAALSDTALKYTGKALKPKVTVTVKVGTKTVTLTQGTDFTVKYLNNKKPGTATVTITGKGNFTGTVKLTFDIMKK